MTTPGWYKDPNDPTRARWHDGQKLTEHSIVMGEHSAPPPDPTLPQPAFQAPPAPPTYQYDTPAAASQPAAPTRQQARADAASAKARAKALRPWYRKKRFVIPLAVVVLGIIIAAAGGGGDKNSSVTASNDGQTTTTGARSVNSGEHPAADDVAVTSCEDQGYGIVKIGVQVINHTTKPSNYIVSLAVTDSAGTKVGDGTAATNNLGPGATANLDTVGTASSAKQGAISCTVVSVTRYASA